MTQDLPPLTLDDVMAATGKNRRNMQEIVRQYLLITGDEVAYYKRRNFLEMRFTPEQRDIILAALKDAADKRISYADAFREHARGGQPHTSLADLDARLVTLEASLEALHRKVDAFQQSLDAALNPA
ncbi:hypothetical protein [Deinococcus aluminii]|uniref:MerR family transcriptional regulator n=1 Tax=Deinococcus aluminii TaxID=1656885 RepID=A0ABP9XEV9_9DEIO